MSRESESPEKGARVMNSDCLEILGALALFASTMVGNRAARADDAKEAGFWAQGQPEHLSVATEAERRWTARRAQARPVDFFLPFYSIDDGVESTVFLMNPIADPISVALTALDGRGGELPLGTHVIEPRRHLELSLRESLRGFEETFGTGSLRMNLLGDADTLQAWMVLSSSDGHSFETPVSSPTKMTYTSFYSFWDETGVGARHVRFELLNVSDSPRQVEVTTPQGSREVTDVLVVVPGTRVRLERVNGLPLRPSGWLRLSHDGDPGDLLAVGLVADRSPIAALPLVSVGEARERRHYESMPLPPADGRPQAFARLVLFHSTSEPQAVTLEAIDADSGTVLDRQTVALVSGEVRSVALRRALPITVSAETPVRLRVLAEVPGLLAQAFMRMPDGSLADLMLFPRDAAHGNGTYPLPELSRYETITILVNLSAQDSTIVAQVNWRGGTYALGPLTVPAGSARRIDLEALAETADADLSGRKLDAERPEGVLKWSVLEGGDELVARTVVMRRGHEDRFGFNCWGCCWQTPEGRMVPEEVAFPAGEERGFQASVLITDCAGTMGPFPTDADVLSYSAPFSWDGSTVTTSTAADDSFGFEDYVMRITPTCASIWDRIFGFGWGYTCKKTFNPRNYDPRETCTTQTSSCYECDACCQNLYQTKVCQGKDLHLRDSELRGCLQNCDTDACP